MTALAATDRQQFSLAVPLVTGSRGVRGGSWLRTRMFHTSITSTAVQFPGGSAPCFLQRERLEQLRPLIPAMVGGSLPLKGGHQPLVTTSWHSETLAFGSTLHPRVLEGEGAQGCVSREWLVWLKGHEAEADRQAARLGPEAPQDFRGLTRHPRRQPRLLQPFGPNKGPS